MSQNTNKIMAWIDDRLPVTQTYEKHMSKYYAPKNFNFWYFFGVLSMLMLVNQILTGIWLTMQFTPSAEAAFASVEYIMRDVEWGWLIRYMHSTGAHNRENRVRKQPEIPTRHGVLGIKKALIDLCQ